MTKTFWILIFTVVFAQSSEGQDPQIEEFAKRIEANYLKIDTLRGEYLIASSAILPDLENVHGQPGPAARDARVRSESSAKFHANFQDERFASEFHCRERIAVDPKTGEPITSRAFKRFHHKIVKGESCCWSANIPIPEYVPEGVHATTTLIQYPLSHADGFSAHQSVILNPFELFKAFGWRADQLLRFTNPGTSVELLNDSKELPELKVNCAELEILITLDKSFAYNPVQMSLAYGGENTCFEWKYFELDGVYLPRTLKYTRTTEGKSTATRIYQAKRNSFQINHEIPESTYSEKYFELQEGDRFTDLDRNNFEMVNGEKAEISPVRPKN